MAIRENLARHLHMIREQRGMTITQFSEQCGIARSSMQLILSGKGNPRLDTIEHIARRLDVSPLSLLSGQSEDISSPTETQLHQLLEQLNELLENSHE